MRRGVPRPLGGANIGSALSWGGRTARAWAMRPWLSRSHRNARKRAGSGRYSVPDGDSSYVPQLWSPWSPSDSRTQRRVPVRASVREKPWWTRGGLPELQLQSGTQVVELKSSTGPGAVKKVKRSWYFKAEPLLGVWLVAMFTSVAYQVWGLWCFALPALLLFLYVKAYVFWLLSLLATPLVLFLSGFFWGNWEAFSWLGLYVPVGLYFFAWALMEIELHRRLDEGITPEQVGEAHAAEILGKPTRDESNGEGH